MKESLRLLKDDPVAQARIHEARALAQYRLGAYSDALRDVTAGLNRLKALETPEAKDVTHSLLARRAQIYLQQGKPRDAIKTAHRVVEEAEPLGPSIALRTRLLGPGRRVPRHRTAGQSRSSRRGRWRYSAASGRRGRPQWRR